MHRHYYNEQLNKIMEGKVWDSVKKVWHDHKGKIIAGAGIAAAVTTGMKLRKNKPTQPTQQDEPTLEKPVFVGKPKVKPDIMAAVYNKNKKEEDRKSKLKPVQTSNMSTREKTAIVKKNCPSGRGTFKMGKFDSCS